MTVLDLATEVKRKVSWRQPRPELGCRAKGKKKKVVSNTENIVSFPAGKTTTLSRKGDVNLSMNSSLSTTPFFIALIIM
jgi:hypothetical protein